MNTEQRIAYAVAFKGVIDLVATGRVKFETNDVVAEVIELTDAFNDAYALRTGLDMGSPKAASTTGRFSSSPKQESKSTGSTKKESKGPKDPDAAASPAQIGFLKKLIRESNTPSDSDGFELDGVTYEFDDFTMGSIQVPIEALKS